MSNSSFQRDHNHRSSYKSGILGILLSGIFLSLLALAAFAATPRVGERAPDFSADALEGGKIKLSQVTKSGPAALIFLRGYPGYQCPLCTMQVAELLRNASKFATAKAQIILVYPGPADNLKAHAQEFVTGKSLPKNVRLVLDPDYKVVNQYGLRWEAQNETAYPSSFVIDKGGKVVYAKISKEHGDRAKTGDLLAALNVK
jgi:alkyl hydroperoxide reductase subunit AhpC